MTFSLASLLMTLSYCIIPLYLLTKLWKNRSEDLLSWILWVSATTVYMLSMYYLGAWAMVLTGYYWRNLLLAAFAIVTIKSYLQVKRRLLSGWYSFRNLCSLLIVGFICIAQVVSIYSSYKVSQQVPQAVELDFPLKDGTYYIVQGGNDVLLNHHYEVSAQKYAIDITKLNQLGSRCNALYAPHLENYNIFGETIYSPCNGRIVRLVNEHESAILNTTNPDHPAGNFLAIQIDQSNHIVILAHLMKDTFLIKEGDFVIRGQPLAKVGNSGNTSEPHLHMHVVESSTHTEDTIDDLLFDKPGIPMRFNGEFLIRNQLVAMQ